MICRKETLAIQRLQWAMCFKANNLRAKVKLVWLAHKCVRRAMAVPRARCPVATVIILAFVEDRLCRSGHRHLAINDCRQRSFDQRSTHEYILEYWMAATRKVRRVAGLQGCVHPL